MDRHFHVRHFQSAHKNHYSTSMESVALAFSIVNITFCCNTFRWYAILRPYTCRTTMHRTCNRYSDHNLCTILLCCVLLYVHGVYCSLGGRHYSDRLCSNRRYSDNLHSGRPSTSLACLAYVEIVEIGNKLEWVEAVDASKARH